MTNIDEIEQAFAQVEQALLKIEDPVEQVLACDRLHWMIHAVMIGNDRHQIRQRAADQAIHTLGLGPASKAIGYAPDHLRRVAGL